MYLPWVICYFCLMLWNLQQMTAQYVLLNYVDNR